MTYTPPCSSLADAVVTHTSQLSWCRRDVHAPAPMVYSGCETACLPVMAVPCSVVGQGGCDLLLLPGQRVPEGSRYVMYIKCWKGFPNLDPRSSCCT